MYAYVRVRAAHTYVHNVNVKLYKCGTRIYPESMDISRYIPEMVQQSDASLEFRK